MLKSFKQIASRRGVKGLFSGISAMALGAAPAHAAFFSIYELTKFSLGGNMIGHHPFKTAFAGMCATVCFFYHFTCIQKMIWEKKKLALDSIMTPMDAVKQRMQLGIKQYKGPIHCLKSVVRTEGFGALYAGFTSTLTMNLPYHAIFFSSYESYKKLSKQFLYVRREEHKQQKENARDDVKDEHDVLLHLVCGGGAGVTAGAITTPLDVARTRLQTQGEVQIGGNSVKAYKGMIDCLSKIWTQEGMRGAFSGIKERMLFHSMSAAICWATYEYFKHILSW